MREFDTGATRDSEEGKFDYEGFLSHSVIWRYALYMNEHRVQTDGKLRASDNWQKGIPRSAYIKSLFRHFMTIWGRHRDCYNPTDEDKRKELEDALCAVIFNASGYLLEVMKNRDIKQEKE